MIEIVGAPVNRDERTKLRPRLDVAVVRLERGDQPSAERLGDREDATVYGQPCLGAIAVEADLTVGCGQSAEAAGHAPEAETRLVPIDDLGREAPMLFQQRPQPNQE